VPQIRALRPFPAGKLTAVILYTCGQKKAFGRTGHFCGRAALALDEAGHEYEIRTVKGYRAVPWHRLTRKTDRAEITRLSGTPEVPILVLDDGSVISDSSRIVQWAREHPAARVAQ
jgi:glutathione S-transferase